MRRGIVVREELSISLRYEGPDVDDGSMSVEDIIPVLEGFSGAYAKIADDIGAESTHRIKIVGIRRGSADILLQIWNTIGENSDAIGGVAAAAGLGVMIVRGIIWIIRAKRHVEGKAHTEQVAQQENTINITNHLNVTLQMPFDAFDKFKRGVIDREMSKIVSPLREGGIEAVELSAPECTSDELHERISIDEKKHFAVEETETTITTEEWIDIKINRCTKTTNNGTAFLTNGDQVSFSYKGDNPEKLYALYAYAGPLRAKCRAVLNESLRVIRIEIFDLEKSNSDLFEDTNSKV